MKGTMPALHALMEQLERATRRVFGAGTFQSRLRTQKAVYLLKQMGHPVAASYRFSQYHYGPYSPDLAVDYFGKASIRAAQAVDLSSRAKDVIAAAVTKGDDFLEAVATVHAVAASNPGASKTRILARVAEMKPRLRRILEEAWRFLEENGLGAGRTWTPAS